MQETIKWGMPSFDYKGPYFSMDAFKQHCVAGFWKYKLLKDPKGYLGEIILMLHEFAILIKLAVGSKQ